MSELEQQLNRILNDPGQMAKIAGLAQSLMDGGEPPQTGSPAETGRDKAQSSMPDPAILGKLGKAMGAMNRDDDKQALLRSLAPYLSQRRREKLEKAMKLARLIHLAEFAFGDLGGSHAQI